MPNVHTGDEVNDNPGNNIVDNPDSNVDENPEGDVDAHTDNEVNYDLESEVDDDPEGVTHLPPARDAAAAGGGDLPAHGRAQLGQQQCQFLQRVPRGIRHRLLALRLLHR